MAGLRGLGMKAVRDYVVTHWRGRSRLWVSFWINGVLVYFVSTGIVVWTGTTFANMGFGSTGGAVLVAGWVAIYIWQLVGIVRCGIRSIRSPSPLSKVFGGAAIAATILVVLITVSDLKMLFG